MKPSHFKVLKEKFFLMIFSTSYILRNGVSGELDSDIHIKVVNCFHQTDTTNLKKVIHIFIVVVKALDHRQDEPEVSLNISIPRFLVAFLNAREERVLFLIL